MTLKTPSTVPIIKRIRLNKKILYALAIAGLSLFTSLQGHTTETNPAEKTTVIPTITLTLNVPHIKAAPYHRPYIATWLETKQRKPIVTLALWAEDETWLKDMRQWWRKLGRQSMSNQTPTPDVTLDHSIDGISGATRKPGRYTLQWPNQHTTQADIDAVKKRGTILLNIEAVREEGDRTYIRRALDIQSQSIIHIPANGELGSITIKIE